MIEDILPDDVIAVDTREELDVVLYAEERAALGRAVVKRSREFVTARACAREALRGLGLPALPIPAGAHGEPQWPVGVVGSITHCDGYRAAAVARAADYIAIGIDAEPNAALPDGVLAEIATVAELSRLRELARVIPAVHWDRALFSAKEAVYKAWFPLVQSRLGFEDAILDFDPHRGLFSARLLVPGPRLGGGRLTGLSGRWTVRDGFVLTTIALAAHKIPR